MWPGEMNVWEDVQSSTDEEESRHVRLKGFDLTKEWHERFDNPENPEGIVRIEDEDNLDAGIETVIVGKAGQSTVIEFSM